MQGKKAKKELKEKVLTESFKKGCSITLLAKEYKISPRTVQRWRTEHKRQKKNLNQATFVEISLPPNTCSLKKVELTFDDYTCSVAGQMRSDKLIRLVQLLEDGLC